MKVNVEAVMKTLDGEEIKQGEKPLTLGRVAADALTASFPDEKDLSGEDKVKRFQLATKMIRSDNGLPIDLTPDEAVLAKKVIGKAFGPLIVGQAYPLLNGE